MKLREPFNYGEWMDLGYQYQLNGFPAKAKEIWKYAARMAHEFGLRGHLIREK